MRPTKDETFMSMAISLSKRSTCSRRQVGCILTDSLYHVIGSGYNGNGAGLSHCIDNSCPGAVFSSGSGLDLCEAIHAEQNALIQCKNVQEIYIAYCTTMPCISCMKLFLNTSVRKIVYKETYSHENLVKELLKKTSIELELLDVGRELNDER